MKKSLTLFFIIFFGLFAQFCDAASINSARSIQVGGYSIANYESVNATAYDANFVPGMTYSNRSSLAWASRFLGGQIYFDLNAGYQNANWDGVRQLIVANGGTYAGTPTLVLTSPYCNVYPTGTLNMAGGHIVSATITQEGHGCNGGVAATVTGGSGSGGVVYAVTGGTGNLGVPGEGTTGTLARISDFTNSPASMIVLEDGANDRGLGISVAQTEANVASIYAALTGAGKTVIDHIEGPIQTSGCAGGCLFSSNQYKEVLQTNAWRRKWVRDVQSEAAGSDPSVITFDTTAEETDGASASGAPLPNMRDAYGVHPLTPASIIDGLKLAEQIRPLLGIKVAPAATNQNDVYDATYNPNGFLNVDPFMATNGGYNPSTCTGSPADHWGLVHDNGTVTGGCTIAVSARSDGYSGNQMVFTASIGSGTANEMYSMSWYDAPANYNITSADLIYGECDVDVSNTTKLNWLELDVVPMTYPAFATLADINDGDNAASGDLYPDTGKIGALDGHPMHFRTPPFPMANVAGGFSAIANVKIAFHIGFDASGGANSAGGTFKLSNCGIRKYLP